MKEPKYRKAYDALEEEFAFASAAVNVRNRAGLTLRRFYIILKGFEDDIATYD